MVVLLLGAIGVIAFPPSRVGAPHAGWPASETETVDSSGPVDDTACAGQVGRMADFTPVLALELPVRAHWLNRTPSYVFDHTSTVAAGFDRVGYCLELTGPSGSQWVWTAMEPFTADARRLGLPTRSGQVVRQRVSDFEVASNVPGLTTGTGLAGYLEMWPNTYGPANSRQISGAAPDRFDADDDPWTDLGYGSFQVHQVGPDRASAAVPQTVLAVNGFAAPDVVLSLGIGSAANGSTDWTFANNAGQFARRRLTVYARPSVLVLTAHPQSRQLYPREGTNTATVTVSGRVNSSHVGAVRLTVATGDKVWEETRPVRPGTEFSFLRSISAGLRDYRFELRALGTRLNRRVGVWDRVVAGDVYVIQGQSNAVAVMRQGSAAGEESPYIRSFGSGSNNPLLSTADRTWHYGIGDLGKSPGSVGQWGIQMAHRIVATYGVPVAVFNGGDGGKPIVFFQRNNTRSDDPNTNYGRLRQRLTSAGVLANVRAVFWYQGEADDNRATIHTTGVTNLLGAWRREFGTAITGGARYYVYQVRTSPCPDAEAGQLREAQRQMGERWGVAVLSTNGLSGHDGCHFAWEHGYQQMGDWAFAAVDRDLYGGSGEAASAPNPRAASFGNTKRTEIIIELRTADRLTVQPGAHVDFRLNGSPITVTEAEYRAGGRLVLTLSGPVGQVTGVSYLGHSRSGPWIVNDRGIGLLAFYNFPLGAR